MRKTLCLIPVPLDEESPISFNLAQDAVDIIRDMKYFIVENEKTARAFLKKLGISTAQKDLTILTYNKKERLPFKEYFKLFEHTDRIGLMSEAGCPGIADPGAEIVAEAHKKGYFIQAFVGPSSILLSLMSSGFNGQNFAFVGYIPIDKADRLKRIGDLERSVEKFNQTQLFIETPFRNNHLFDDIVHVCKDTTLLCIAAGITSKNEFIKTMTIADWKKNKPELHKIPCIFILGKFNN